MASSKPQYVGPEARYLSRFKKIGSISGESIKNTSEALNVTQVLTYAKASISAQEGNIRSLFSTAQEMISGIDTLQQMLGHTFVKNMPPPSKEIMESPGKQLGYVQLTMRFMQAGVLHFMEEMSNADERILELESTISKIAVYNEEDIHLIGEMQSLDLDMLEGKAEIIDHPVAAHPINTPTPIMTPPTSPVNTRKDPITKAVEKKEAIHASSSKDSKKVKKTH